MASARPIPAPSTRWPYWHLVISAAVAGALVIAVDAYVSHQRSPPATSERLLRPIYGPKTHAEAIAGSDTQIAIGHDWARKQPENWLRQEGLARALMARARLSSSYDELAEAAAVMARARAIPPDPAGPLLADAALGMMLHRPAQAERALAALNRWAVPPEGHRPSGHLSESAMLTRVADLQAPFPMGVLRKKCSVGCKNLQRSACDD